MTPAGTPVAPGTRLGPYEVAELIGSGGMADVYRAHDTRLNRTVAIKVLSAHAADTHERRLRLDREARAVSVLSHPGICVLYDVGVDGDRPFLVMEYVSGESLAQRLRRGPMPLRDALRIAVAIADALDHAHRQGVIHRDLKPANVMIAATGIKLVDFGLARLREPETELAPSSSDDTESITQDGVLLGTLPYMSPEQVEAKQADARSDLFALGAILYEMVTARRAFDADSKAGLIVSILERDPPPIAQPLSAPPSNAGPIAAGLVQHVVARCLAKQPDDRWQTAADLKRELQWVLSEEWPAQSAAATPGAHARSRWAALAGAIVTIGLAGWAWSAWRTPARANTPVSMGAPVTFELSPPPGLELMGGNASPQNVVSPDGTWIVYAASESGISSQLWATHLTDNTSRPLPDTTDARYPFWAPDSQSIGFFARGHVYVTRLDSASSVPIAEAVVANGGAWGADDVIVFSGLPKAELMRVSARGGEARPATTLDASRKETAHTWPSFLPDGRHFLYHAESSDRSLSGIWLGSTDGSAPRWLFQSDLRAAYARGSIVFGVDGTVLMQPFDIARGERTGRAVPIATNVGYNDVNHRMALSISDSTLVYRSELPTSPVSLDWKDRAGRVITSMGPPDTYTAIRLSPDGRWAAVTRSDFSQPSGTATMWLFDVASGTHRVLADHIFQLSTPSWSPDSSAVAYSEESRGFVRADIRTGTVTKLARDVTALHLTDWSPDGRVLLYGVSGLKQAWDVWQLTLDGTGETPFLASTNTEGHAQFSPDGRWVTYVSDESGQKEVWVRSFTTPSMVFKISDGGGYNPLWRADGRALYYLDAHRQIVEVDVQLSPTFSMGASRTLFKIWISEGIAEVYASQYAVSSDGRRFLVKTPIQPPPPATVRVNWRPLEGR